MIDSELCRLLLRHWGSLRQAHIVGSSSCAPCARTLRVQSSPDRTALAGPAALVASTRSVRSLLAHSGNGAVADPSAIRLETFNSHRRPCRDLLISLLPNRDIMFEPFTRGAPPWEGRRVRWVYPLEALLGLLRSLAQPGVRCATRIRKLSMQPMRGWRTVVGSSPAIRFPCRFIASAVAPASPRHCGTGPADRSPSTLRALIWRFHHGRRRQHQKSTPIEP